MRVSSISRVLVVLVVTLLMAGPVLAQDKGIVFGGGWAPQWVGTHGHLNVIPAGLFVNVAGTVVSNLQVVGDLGWSNKVGVNLTTFTGGLRYLVRKGTNGKAMPFVEGLVGGCNISNPIYGTGFAAGVGAGVDVKALRNANVRIQVNYFLNRNEGVNINEIRVGIGISANAKK
jgi:hypothetical protein